jgi:hypothetical protein
MTAQEYADRGFRYSYRDEDDSGLAVDQVLRPNGRWVRIPPDATIAAGFHVNRVLHWDQRTDTVAAIIRRHEIWGNFPFGIYDYPRLEELKRKHNIQHVWIVGVETFRPGSRPVWKVPLREFGRRFENAQILYSREEDKPFWRADDMGYPATMGPIPYNTGPNPFDR